MSTVFIMIYFRSSLNEKKCCNCTIYFPSLYPLERCNMKNSIDSIHPPFVDLSKPAITSSNNCRASASFQPGRIRKIGEFLL